MKIIAALLLTLNAALPCAAMASSNPPPEPSGEQAIIYGTGSPDIYHRESPDAEEWGVYTPPVREKQQPYSIQVEPRVILPMPAPLPAPER